MMFKIKKGAADRFIGIAMIVTLCDNCVCGRTVTFLSAKVDLMRCRLTFNKEYRHGE
jgi:hypothetical protein